MPSHDADVPLALVGAELEGVQDLSDLSRSLDLSRLTEMYCVPLRYQLLRVLLKHNEFKSAECSIF